MEEKLKLAIDSESVNIYIDNGGEQDPTHVCYWHIEEWEEDSEVAISIFNAITIRCRRKMCSSMSQFVI